MTVTLTAVRRGTGRPLVVLPWFRIDAGATAGALDGAFVAASAGQLQRVYVDLPGCGGSAPVEPSSAAVLAAVETFLDAEFGPPPAGRPFLLAGLSYGGYLAAAVARRRPEQLDGLLLVTPAVRIRPAERTAPPPLPDPGGDWAEAAPPELRDWFSRAIGTRTRASAEAVAALLRACGPSHEDYLERLRADGYQLADESVAPTFAGPTAVLTGRADAIAGYIDQFAAALTYAAATYAALAGAGHFLPLEQPDAFGALVRDWLVRCQARQPWSGAAAAG